MDEEGTVAHSTEVARGTFWGLLGNVFLKAVSFLYVVYVARAVSQDDVGIFYLSLSIIGLVGAWRDFGLPSSLARYVPYFESRKEGGKVRSLLRYTYLLNALSGIVLTAALWLGADAIGAFFQNASLPAALRLISSFMLIENLFKVGSGFLQGKADIKSLQAMNAAQNLLKLVLTVIFFQIFGASLAWLTWAFLLSYVAAMAVFAPHIARNYSSLPAAGETLPLRELVREIAPFGLVLSAIQLISTLISYSDRAILGYLLPPATANETIAVYSLAVTLAMNIMVFPGAVGGIFMPLISRLVGMNDMDSVRKVMGTAQRWTLFLTLPFAVVMTAFAGEMLVVLYGQSYAGGAAAMSIFMLGMFFSFFTQVIALALAGMRLVNLEFKIVLAMGTLNVVLNFLLVPLLGMDGSALASAASFGVSALLFCHYGWKLAGFRMPSAAYKMVFAGAVTLVLLFLLRPIVLSAASAVPSLGTGEEGVYLTKGIRFGFIGLIAAFSGAAFALFCLFLKCFEQEDIDVMRKAAKRVKMPPQLLAVAERAMLLGVSEKK